MCSHFVFIFRYTSIPTLTMFRNKKHYSIRVVFCQWSLYTYLFRPKEFVFTRPTPPGSGYSDRITTFRFRYTGGAGAGCSRRTSDSLYCAVKKPAPTSKMPFPPLCDFLFLHNNFSGISPCIFHGWARKACLQSSYCVPCAGRIFVRNHTSVSEAFALFGQAGVLSFAAASHCFDSRKDAYT